MQTINEYEGLLQEAKAERDHQRKQAEVLEVKLRNAEIKIGAEEELISAKD